MTDRLIDLSEHAAHLSIDGGLLSTEIGDSKAKVPTREIAAVSISHPGTAISGSALAALGAATQLRRFLLRQGFQMLQFSVYARYLDSADAADEHASHTRLMLPRESEGRILSITDRQFGKMQVFSGKKRLPPELPPEQLMLF